MRQRGYNPLLDRKRDITNSMTWNFRDLCWRWPYYQNNYTSIEIFLEEDHNGISTFSGTVCQYHHDDSLTSDLPHHCATDLDWWLDLSVTCESDLFPGWTTGAPAAASPHPRQPRYILFTSVNLGLQCLCCQGVRHPSPRVVFRVVPQLSVLSGRVLGQYLCYAFKPDWYTRVSGFWASNDLGQLVSKTVLLLCFWCFHCCAVGGFFFDTDFLWSLLAICSGLKKKSSWHFWCICPVSRLDIQSFLEQIGFDS